MKGVWDGECWLLVVVTVEGQRCLLGPLVMLPQRGTRSRNRVIDHRLGLPLGLPLEQVGVQELPVALMNPSNI